MRKAGEKDPSVVWMTGFSSRSATTSDDKNKTVTVRFKGINRVSQQVLRYTSSSDRDFTQLEGRYTSENPFDAGTFFIKNEGVFTD